MLLNKGNGTFAAMQTYTAGPQCAGVAVDPTLGDVTRPAPGNRLPSTPGVDAVAVADVDGDGCGDVVAAGAFGRE